MKNEPLGKRLKKAREHLNISAAALAQATGVNVNEYQDNESGDAAPKSAVLINLAGLGISGQWLLAGTGPMVISNPTSEKLANQQDMLRIVLDNDAEAYARRDERVKKTIERGVRTKLALSALPTEHTQSWESSFDNALNRKDVSEPPLDALIDLFVTLHVASSLTQRSVKNYRPQLPVMNEDGPVCLWIREAPSS